MFYSTLLCLALCFEYCQPYPYVIFSIRAVVRAFPSHQCGSGSNPGVDAICELSLLLVLSFALWSFSMDTTVKTQHLKISIRFVEVLPLKLSLVIYCVRGTRTQPLICVGCSVHYWVSCAINKGGFFEIAFSSSSTHICLALGRLLTFCLTLTR